MKKTVVIVGNAPLSRDLSQDIDGADFVVRFNEPEMSTGKGGTRTDLLILATTNKPMQMRLQKTTFSQSPAFREAKEIMLAYHPSIIRAYHPKPNIISRLLGRRADWTLETIEALGIAGKEVRIMPPQFYIAGCEELDISPDQMHRIFPSTGFLGIRHMLEKYPAENWDMKLCGFTWEGWKRHAWGNERAWVEQKIDAGRLAMIV